MRVIQKVQSTSANPQEPVDMPFYQGDNVAEGIAAVASIMASKDDTVWYRTIEIRVEF